MCPHGQIRKSTPGVHRTHYAVVYSGRVHGRLSVVSKSCSSERRMGPQGLGTDWENAGLDVVGGRRPDRQHASHQN